MGVCTDVDLNGCIDECTDVVLSYIVVCIDMCAHVCMDMRTDVSVGVCVDVRIGNCGRRGGSCCISCAAFVLAVLWCMGVCVDMCRHMCVDVCIHMRIDMCIDKGRRSCST